MQNHGMFYEITKEDSKRIDLLKIWMCILVVYIHAYIEYEDYFTGNIVVTNVSRGLWNVNHLVSQCIGRSAVPAFFMISAILLYRKEFKWKENVKKKAWSLMVPYFIVHACWIAIYAVVQQFPQGRDFFSHDDSLISNWGVYGWLRALLGIRTGFPLIGPLWFMRDLFVLNILAVILKKLIDKWPVVIGVFLSIMWFFNIGTGIFCLNSTALCFFSLGYYIVKYNVTFPTIDKLNIKWLAFVYTAFEILDCALRGNAFGGYVHQLAIVIGVVFWCRCTVIIRKQNIQKLVQKLAPYSFGIFLFHEKTISILRAIGRKILPQNLVGRSMEYFVIPIIIISMCIGFCYILRRAIPGFYAVIMGGRKERKIL